MQTRHQAARVQTIFLAIKKVMEPAPPPPQRNGTTRDVILLAACIVLGVYFVKAAFWNNILEADNPRQSELNGVELVSDKLDLRTVSPAATSPPSTTSQSPTRDNATLAPVASLDALFKPYLLDGNDGNFDGCFTRCQKRNVRHSFAAPEEPCKGGTEFWCSSYFTQDKIDAACRFLCANQYPADCSKAKYLIITSDWPNGYGSDNHIRIFAFTYALMQNRVYLHDPRAQSRWTHAEDPYPACAKRNPFCYYVSLTNCTLPLGWEAKAEQFNYGHNDGQFVLMPALEDIGPLRQTDVPHNAPVQFPVQLWKAHIAALLFRPNEHFMRNSVLPKVHKTFNLTDRLLPERFICVFIRRGDKWREAPLQPVETYWTKATELLAALNVRDIYLTSDSPEAIEQFHAIAKTKLDAGELRIAYIAYERFKDGISGELIATYVWNKPAVRNLLEVHMTDLFIASQGVGWVGTLSSNHGRFQNEMRLGNGGFGTRYHSRDANGQDQFTHRRLLRRYN